MTSALPSVPGVNVLSLALVLVSLVGSPPTDPSALERVDAYIEEHREELDVPGIAYAMVRGDEVVHQGTAGTDGEGAPVTPHTPFLVGSVSKTFTALAVMQLAESGRLDLDRPVAQTLAWFRLADEDASDRITPRQLLTHTSGISEAAGLRVADRFDNDPRAVERAVRDLADVSPVADPGAEYEYSSANYLLLGALVEAVSGTSFGDHLEETVLDPLGMDDAIVRTETAERLPPGHRLAFGRAWEFDPGYDTSGVPYGYVGASLDDLTHFVAAELNRGRYAGQRVLDPAAVRLTQEPSEDPPDDGYRYGWRADELGGWPTLWHSGATPGYFATVLLAPEEELGVIVLQNAYGPARDGQLNEVASNIVRILRGEPPRDVGPDPLLTWAPWLLLGTAVAVLSATVASTMRTRRRVPSRRRSLGWMAAAGCLGGVAVLLPRFMGADFARARLWTPDLAIGIVAVVVACALATISGGVLALRVRRRPEPDPSRRRPS